MNDKQKNIVWNQKKITPSNHMFTQRQIVENQLINNRLDRLNILQIRKKNYFLRIFKLILRIYKIDLFRTYIQNIFVQVKGNDIVQSSC